MAQLKLANTHIDELNNKVGLQESIILNLEKKDTNNQEIILSERRKTEIYQEELKTTQKELRKLKAKRTFERILSGAIFVTLSYLYITK